MNLHKPFFDFPKTTPFFSLTKWVLNGHFNCVIPPFSDFKITSSTMSPERVTLTKKAPSERKFVNETSFQSAGTAGNTSIQTA